MQNALANKDFISYSDYFVLSILIENDDVVQVRTVLYELSLLQSSPNKACLTVNVELLVGVNHLCCYNRIKASDFSMAWVFLSVFLL